MTEKRRTLDLIVTHWNEPWGTVRKMFDMLEHQRGVAQDDFRVIVVQDGPDGRLDWEAIRKSYSFRMDIIDIPHGGVSRARNAGMDRADAEWICFCDCDDMFTSVYSLKSVMDMMRDPKAAQVSMLYTTFVSEHGTKNGIGLYEETKQTTWIHGKFFRLDDLRKTGIRFDERLWFGEDSAFLSMLRREDGWEGAGRVVAPRYPLYAWAYRGDSVTQAEENKERFALGSLEKNKAIMDHMRGKGLDEDGRNIAARIMWDMYYETAGQETDTATYEAIVKFYRENRDEIAKVDDAYFEKIGEYAWLQHRRDYAGKSPGMSIREWMEMIGRVTGGEEYV